MSPVKQQADCGRRGQLARSTGLALAGVLAVALALRLWGLGRESLWLDEATSLRLARMSIHDLLVHTAFDVHPPLYYLLLRWWLRFGQSEVALRSLSVIGGVLGVGLTFFVGRELFDERTGLAGAVLLAVAPLHIWHAQEVRGYAWQATFCTLALFGLARVVAVRLQGRPQRSRWSEAIGWLAYISGAALAMYTHYYSLFVLLAANILALGLAALRRRLWPFVGLWLAAQAMVGLLYLPWWPVLRMALFSGGSGWVAILGSPDLEALSSTVVSFIVGGAQPWLPVLVRRLSYGVFMAALVLGVVWGSWPWADEEARRRREGVIVAGLAFALPLATVWLVSQIKPIFAGRYFLPFLPPFLILVGRGAMAFRRRWLRLLALVLLLVGPFWATVEQARRLENPDWRGLAARIAREAQPGDGILLVPSFNAKPLDYYLQGRVPIGDWLEPVDPQHPEPALEIVRRMMGTYRRIWLIWAKGHYSDPTGVVAGYLDGHARRLESETVPGAGEVILYQVAASP